LFETDSPASGPISRREASHVPARRPERRGFTIEAEGSLPLFCGELLGFRESLVCLVDSRAQMPLRIGILAASIELDTWLDAWAEDDTQVRRTITLRRRVDGKAVTVIVTLASHGFGVDPSLALESVTLPRGSRPPKITRSGTYLKVDVNEALGPREAESEIVAIEPSFG
jgi:hypothetical protein